MREEIFAGSFKPPPRPQRIHLGLLVHSAAPPHPRLFSPLRPAVPCASLLKEARQGARRRRMAGAQRGDGSDGRPGTGSVGPTQHAVRGWCFVRQPARTGRPRLLRDLSWVHRGLRSCPAPLALASFFNELASPLISSPSWTDLVLVARRWAPALVNTHLQAWAAVLLQP